MTAAYDPHGEFRREPLLTPAQLAELIAQVNADILASRTESARLASDTPPWPGFTARCDYSCRRGCDH